MFVQLFSVFAQGKVEEMSTPKTSVNLNAGQVNDSTIEEKIVRMAYRKMNILDTVERFVKANRNEQPTGTELNLSSLRFDLRNFRVGQIQEIQNAVYQNLVTPPTGEIIQISTINSTQNNGETKISLNSVWRKGQYVAGFDPQWTVEDILQLEAARFHDVGRYASYDVSVSLEGKTRTYHALALFHNLYQPKGMLNPEFLDGVVGMGGIITQILNDVRLPLGMKHASNQETNLIGNAANTRFDESFSKQPGREIEPNLLAPPDGGGGCLEWYYTPIDPTYTFCMVWDPFYYGGGGGDDDGSSTGVCSIDSPVNLILTADQFISKCCKASVRSEFPGELLYNKVEDIKNNRSRNNEYKTAWKLISRGEYRK